MISHAANIIISKYIDKKMMKICGEAKKSTVMEGEFIKLSIISK